MSAKPVLGAEFFKSNRRRLREAFSGTAPIIISGNYLIQKNGDEPYNFEQDSNFWYLTGLDEPGLILVLDGDKEYLLAPNHDPVREVFEGRLDTSKIFEISGIETIYESDEGWKHLGRKIVKVKHVATLQPPPVFVESIVMFTSPAKAHLVEKIKSFNPEVDLIDLRKVISGLRSIKQAEELESMKQAIKQTAKLYKVLEKKRKSATNEVDILIAAQKNLIESSTEFAYNPIVASGKNALTLHYTANNDMLDTKGFLLIDMATKYGKYCADITRSVVDAPTKRQKDVYDAVLQVQNYAIQLLGPGVMFDEYEQKVHDFMGEKLRELGLIKIIDKDSVRQFYPHSTSHFLGIDTHDSGDYKSALQPGMVLTVEPGIYIASENIGVRLEDVVLITEKGAKILSEAIIKDITRLAD